MAKVKKVPSFWDCIGISIVADLYIIPCLLSEQILGRGAFTMADDPERYWQHIGLFCAFSVASSVLALFRSNKPWVIMEPISK